MQNLSKYVTGAFLLIGLVTAWVLVRVMAGLMGLIGPAADPILFAGIRLSAILGVGITGAALAYAFNSESIYRGATEVVVELSKVTWPDKADTQRSTKVVIVFSVIISVFLASFDFVWKVITDAVLSG